MCTRIVTAAVAVAKAASLDDCNACCEFVTASKIHQTRNKSDVTLITSRVAVGPSAAYCAGAGTWLDIESTEEW
jgi:hypothetical protein